MTFITNIKINGDLITFELNNKSTKIKTALANAIRRSIISNIETYAINPDSIDFIENTSMLSSAFLTHRLTLIPIVSDLPDINYEELTIECMKINTEEDIESVYVNEFICKINDTIINNEILFKQKDILFAKLKMNQKISFKCNLIKNNAENGGSFFSPVSSCVFTFKKDEVSIKKIMNEMDEDDKKSFMLQDIERIYQKNDDHHPSSYLFSIESIGFFNSPLKVVTLGLNALIDRLTNVKQELNNSKSKKISISLEEDIFKIIFDNENETLGNILSTYLSYTDNVFYAGYIIEHPLNKNILLKIKLNKQNTEKDVILTIIKTIDYVNDLINSMIKDLS